MDFAWKNMFGGFCVPFFKILWLGDWDGYFMCEDYVFWNGWKLSQDTELPKQIFRQQNVLKQFKVWSPDTNGASSSR